MNDYSPIGSEINMKRLRFREDLEHNIGHTLVTILLNELDNNDLFQLMGDICDE